MAWATLYSVNNGTGTGGGGYTHRIVIAASALASSADTVRVLFHKINSPYYYSIAFAYIGLQAVGGDPYDIDQTTMVRLTQGGNTTLTIQDGAVYSDAVSLDIDGTRAVVISLYNSASIGYLSGAYPVGLSAYYKSNSNVSSSADVSYLSTAAANLFGFRGLEGDILYPVNDGTVESSLDEVTSTADSYFAFGDINDLTGEIISAGNSVLPAVECSGNVFSVAERLSSTGISIFLLANIAHKTGTVSAEATTSICCWGGCSDNTRFSGQGHGNVLSHARLLQKPSAVSGAAIVSSAGAIRMSSGQSVFAEGEINPNIAVGTGRIRPATDSVDAASPLFVSGFGGFLARTPTVSAAGESAVACVGRVSPARPRVSAATRAATPSFSFLRDNRSAPTSAVSLPLNILRFERP